MVAALGFLFILAGGLLILTTATATTGQVLGALFGPPASGTSSIPGGPANIAEGLGSAYLRQQAS